MKAISRTAEDVNDDESSREYEGPELIARRMHLIIPDSPRKTAWDWVIIFLVCYNSFMVPFDLAFDLCLGVGLQAFDIIVDILFVIDYPPSPLLYTKQGRTSRSSGAGECTVLAHVHTA